MIVRTHRFRVVLAVLVAGCALVLAGCSAPRASASASASALLSAPASPGVAGPRVVTIGDSITGGSGLAPDEAWPIVLAGARGWAVTNLGTDGAGFLAPGLSDETYDSQVADAPRAHPELVIISASDNDVGQTGDLAAAMTAAMKKLRAELPHATIAATSVIGPAFSPDELAPIDADMKKAVAEVHGVYLDLGDPFDGRDGMLQADGEHPTAAGQQVLADAVGSALTAAHLDG